MTAIAMTDEGKAIAPVVREGQLIREEQEGFKFMLDLQKRDKQEAITTLEAILARLRG
jgi:hypothetical protein